MNDIETAVRCRYLERLDDYSWQDDDPQMEFGLVAMPLFVDALRRETDTARRRRLVSIIWRFRDPVALPALAVASADHGDEVWKEALDGIVAIGGQAAMQILRDAQVSLAADPRAAGKLEWIPEAIQQVQEGDVALPPEP